MLSRLVSASVGVLRREKHRVNQSSIPKYSSYGNENEAPEEGALVEYCRLDKKNQQSVPRICEASTVVSAKLRNPPLIVSEDFEEVDVLGNKGRKE
ncbi:unnamed protein product [Nippostrongylus brasiliensis]|uniref:Uncharacterized protein n=1 Tax=Nippostrongylus brasiliensis TaxID=27835 RepID=A0A0N4XH23_NIPBR|nr:unnamed protein product [Nippostrongylus brasiliensis]